MYSFYLTSKGKYAPSTVSTAEVWLPPYLTGICSTEWSDDLLKVTK